MQTRKLEIHCPLCQSGEVFYTCTPNCCFNHVCGACGATFEPVTRAAGAKISGVVPPDPPPEPGDPTVACALCDAIEVYLDPEGSPVCARCGARLLLELTEIAAG